jgi:uncharacterized protein (DUF305 family)
MSFSRILVQGVAVCVAAAACGVPAGGGAQDAGRAGAPGHTAADVRFMQGMIVHHAQAVAMTALVPERSARADVRRLAARIAVSQDDETAQMRQWLENRNEAVPEVADPHGARAHHGHHGDAHELMPGMLDAAAMARLRAATGAEFDRLFLEGMIRHHEGALTMVAELLATDGAAQEPETFQFASHVESDQRIEIDRMRRMLEAGAEG